MNDTDDAILAHGRVGYTVPADALTVFGSSSDGHVDVELVGGRVTRMVADRQWRTGAPEHEVLASLAEAINRALDRETQEMTPMLPATQDGCRRGTELRYLAADLEAMTR